MKRKRTFVLQETERRGVKGDDIQTTWRLQPDTKPPWHSTSTDIFPVKPTSTLQHITDRRLSPYHLPTKGIRPIEYRKTTRALTWSFYVGRSYIQYIGCFLTQKVTRIHYYQWETRRLSMLRRRILWRWCLDIPSWWEVRFNKTLLKGITMSRIGVVPCQHFNQTKYELKILAQISIYYRRCVDRSNNLVSATWQSHYQVIRYFSRSPGIKPRESLTVDFFHSWSPLIIYNAHDP